MSHIFFAYPSGRVGFGLLLLRAALVLWLASAIAMFAAAGQTIPAIALCLLFIGLAVGFATRVAAGSCSVGLLLAAWSMHTLAMLDLSHAFVAASVALIGPGAFSADAMLFGRRTLRLPE